MLLEVRKEAKQLHVVSNIKIIQHTYRFLL